MCLILRKNTFVVSLVTTHRKQCCFMSGPKEAHGGAAAAAIMGPTRGLDKDN
jgi:hypothetical protein